jgi:hypothetical protein
MEKPPDNQNEERLKPLPDSFFRAKDDYYLGKKGSKRELKWQAYSCAHKGVMDFFQQNKSKMGAPIYGGESFAMYQKLFEAFDLHSPPNRSREELREDLKHHVFIAAIILQRLPVEKPIVRSDIEDLAQKLRAQDEMHSQGNSIVKNVLRLTKDEKKALDSEVWRLHDAGKLKFTRRLWRETGLSGMR